MFFCPFFFILQHKLVAEDAMSSFSAGVLHFHSIYSISLCRVVAHTSSTHVPSVQSIMDSLHVSSFLLHYLLVRLRHERLRIILTFTSQIHCVQDGLVPAHSSCLHNFCPKSSLEWILYISETMIEVSIKTVINDFVFQFSM